MSHRGDDNGSMHNLLDEKSIDLDSYRKLVKSYIDLVSPVLGSEISKQGRNGAQNLLISSTCTALPCSGLTKWCH